MSINITKVDVDVIITFLECLVYNQCSVCVIANYVSAFKAKFIVYNVSFAVSHHPELRYFVKSLKINRPLNVTPHNIIVIDMLSRICQKRDTWRLGPAFRAIFLIVGFFVCFCLFCCCFFASCAFQILLPIQSPPLIIQGT